MKFLKYLLEYHGNAHILYHFTSLDSAINILKSNYINLTAAVGTPSDMKINKKRFFFLSLTRSKSSGYNVGYTKIIFNRDLLKQRYKITPVEYWNWSKNPDDYDTKEDYKRALTSVEQEDRLVSNNSTIPNADKYIEEIHVRRFYNDNYNEGIGNLKYYCEKHNIPLFIYKDEKDFLLETNPIDISEFESKEYVEDRRNIIYDEYRLGALLAFNNEENYNKIINFFKDDDYKLGEFKEHLEKETYNHFRLGAQYDYEALGLIRNWVDQMKTKTNKTSKFMLELLAKDMRKMGVYDLKDYLYKKQWKGKKTKEEFIEELVQHIYNYIDENFKNYFDQNFDEWIVIDNKEYNHGYESPEIRKLGQDYINKIKKTIKKISQDEEKDVLRYPFYLKKDDVLNELGIKKFKIRDKLNITDISYKYDDYTLDDRMTELIDWCLNYDTYPIGKQLYEEYKKQFYA